MATNDYEIIIDNALPSLQKLIDDLELQIGEEGGTYPCALDATQRTLKDAVQRLETVKEGGRLCRPAGATRLRRENTSTQPHRKLVRRISWDCARPNEIRDAAFRRRILSIPKGKVATYGQVATAAGYPLHHRAVARLLRVTASHLLPWQRVVGAGGAIKLRFDGAAEQRLRLEFEGVRFIGRRVDLGACQHIFGAWDDGFLDDLAIELPVR